MRRPTELLPELIVATLSLSLCFTPRNLSIADINLGKLLRITGYSTAIVLFGKSYMLLLLNEEKFKTAQEKSLIDESVDMELYTLKKGAELDKAKLEIKRELMEVASPQFKRMYELECEATPKPPEHPELSEEQKINAARNAVEAAMAPTVLQPKFGEEELRKHFPESMDSTNWKACLKALQTGHSKDEIAVDVLGCKANKELGLAYLELLKSKFM